MININRVNLASTVSSCRLDNPGMDFYLQCHQAAYKKGTGNLFSEDKALITRS